MSKKPEQTFKNIREALEAYVPGYEYERREIVHKEDPEGDAGRFAKRLVHEFESGFSTRCRAR